MKHSRSLIFHQYFQRVEFSGGPHFEYFRWTLEKFGLSSIFPEFGFFQRSILSTFSMKFLRCLDFHRYFPSVGIFQRITHSTFTMKLLGSSDFHRDFLSVGIFQRFTLSTFTMRLLKSSDSHRVFQSVEFFRGLYLVLSDETVEKFGFSSMFSECGLIQKFTLSIFWWNFWEVWFFIDIF